MLKYSTSYSRFPQVNAEVFQHLQWTRFDIHLVLGMPKNIYSFAQLVGYRVT